MWLRHAHSLLLALCILSACSSPDRQATDKLNSLSYAYHYRSLDSTEHYAREAYSRADDYTDGKAEALNNLAFVSIYRMDYVRAKQQLDSVYSLTDNQLELMVADVLQMRLCQRMSHNREFYDYRTLARKSLQRIYEERDQLSERQKARLLYAESELAIVTSTYFYYVGLEQQSVDALLSIGNWVERDTAQWMNLLYNIGAGGIITDGTSYQIEQSEFQCLLQCYGLAVLTSSPYFVGNALEAMADHLASEDGRQLLVERNGWALEELGLHGINDRQIAVRLAEEALAAFQNYGDVYQIAGAYRTLANCHRALGDYGTALSCLEQALVDSAVNQAPDLVASIREQLSVVYAAVNDKAQSDMNRNIYLDLQEQTRQDRSLEARAGQLDERVAQLNKLLVIVVVALLLLIGVLRLLYIVSRRQLVRQEQLDGLHEQREELSEQLVMEQQKLEEAQRRNLEQRAKISLVNSITPLIDRMLHDVQRLGRNEEQDADRLQYVRELTDRINEQNSILTHWIQLRQGELSLHIESFELQQLFDIIEKGRRSFLLKKINLLVLPSTAKVKADKVLTLFMLNTLADNARKCTPEGGSVTVSAEETADYVEISVADTGVGMSEEQLAQVFDHKVAGGHGFGLQNCRGIIEKYKKTSRIFGVCRLSAESRVGEGSRFFFRLPKGIVRTLVVLSVAMGYTTSANADNTLLQHASNYADSTYYSNIRGTYGQTIDFADSCLNCLNQYYLGLHPSSADTLMLFGEGITSIAEVSWLHNGVKLNYNILLMVRNESAVAALALHEWQLYAFNNRIYTQLFKELSADSTLEDYCRKMQQSQTDRSVAVILLILMMLILIVAIVVQVVQTMGRRADQQQKQLAELEMMGDELHRIELEEARLHVSNQVLDNCLSALKHETMYYPSRIRQLVDAGNNSAIQEVAAYYREIYGILSEQARRQTEGSKLHLTRLDNDILGNRVQLDYMFELIRKEAHVKELKINYISKDEQYVVCTIQLPVEMDADFSPSSGNIAYLICRQIVREHGEATGRHACGIRTEQSERGTRIEITLPKYNLCRTSK